MAGIVVLLLVALPSAALAHGRLKASSPSAGAHLGTTPRELRFEFSEVPELNFSEVKLIGPGGQPIALGPLAYTAESHRAVTAAIPGDLPAGTYVVQWQLAGDDGHPVRGRFDFVIAPGAMTMPMPRASGGAMQRHHDPVSMPQGEGFGAESLPYVLVRWVQFVALLLAIGAVSFRQLVLRVLRRRAHAGAPMLGAAEGRAARVGRGAVAVLVATLLLRLFAQSWAMHGAARAWDVTLAAQMIGKTMWGKGWLLELGGVIVAGTGFHLARRGRGWPLATVGAVLLALSLGLAGHAAAAPRLTALAMLADGLHVLGASSWLGTLALVLIAGLPPAAQLHARDRGPMLAAMIDAFSPVALASAGLTAATGVFAAWLHVGRIPNLWGTRYGITLLMKLSILGVVALTGLYNWRIVKPRLGTDAATTHLRRSARVEVAVAVLVLLVTAILVATPTSMDMEM